MCTLSHVRDHRLSFLSWDSSLKIRIEEKLPSCVSNDLDVQRCTSQLDLEISFRSFSAMVTDMTGRSGPYFDHELGRYR